MSFPYVGEIRLFAFGRTPAMWHACDGSLLPIASYEVLFGLIGTTYGGNGETTFGVPDLRGRVPLCVNESLALPYHPLGETGGAETVALTAAQLPAHRHRLVATTRPATSATPGPGLMPGTVSGDTFFVSETAGATAVRLHPAAIAAAGQGDAHPNTMPTTAMHFCIALNGVYPNPN